jgi:hypothetical protein
MIVEQPDPNNIYGAQNNAHSRGPLSDQPNGGDGRQDSAPGLKGKANHLETWNYLFVDGHVKAMRPAATVPPGVYATYPWAGVWTVDDD